MGDNFSQIFFVSLAYADGSFGNSFPTAAIQSGCLEEGRPGEMAAECAVCRQKSGEPVEAHCAEENDTSVRILQRF